MPTYREQPCEDCGTLVHKRVRGDRGVYCASCGEKRISDAVHQMVAGHGPAVDRWRLGMLRAAERLIRENSGEHAGS